MDVLPNPLSRPLSMQLLCTPDELSEGRSRGFTLAGQNLFAVRRAGRVHVYRNRCPHRGTRLEWQADQFLDASGSLVQCAHHGALFLIDSGECIQGPCLAKCSTPCPAAKTRQASGWISRRTPEP